MNVKGRDQVPTEGTALGGREYITWMAPTDDLVPQSQWTGWLCELVQRVLSGARTNLIARKAQKLEEFVTDYQDAFATKNDDCGRTEFTVTYALATLVRSVSFTDSDRPNRPR